MENNQIEIRSKLSEGYDFKISRFKEKIKKTVPHKHDDYYELIFLCEGEGFHWIESEKYLVSTPEVFFLGPGQLHCWQFTSIPKGYVMLFRASFFNDITESNTITLYKQLFKIAQIGLTVDCGISVLLNEIYKEYISTSDYSIHIIHGILRALFAKLLNFAEVKINDSVIPVSLYSRFTDLVVKKSIKMRKIKDFAILLNTTPQNLNATCQKHAGKCASDFISQQLILEAKRLLLHTDNTINEIAYLLSFNDASHFVKFFKRIEGLTPSNFREFHFQ